MKKLFCLLLAIFVFHQTCFAWQFLHWNWKPPVVKDNTAGRIKKLENEATGVKKIIGELDLRVSAIDSKISGLNEEISKNIALNQEISELPGTEGLISPESIPFTANGKYIGNIIGKYGYDKIEYCGGIPEGCITVDINGFYPVRIQKDGTIELNVFTFFDQPDCKGNTYIQVGVLRYPSSNEGEKPAEYITPPLKGSLFDVNGELYYHAKDSPLMKAAWRDRKSFLSYSPDESIGISQSYIGYTGYGRCYNNDPNNNGYEIYVYKLLPNDPAVTGITEYPFTNILIDGRPFIDLSQVPLIQ